MRTTFFSTFFDLIDKGYNLHLITADLGFGVLSPFLLKYSDKITNVGVAEANMVGLAAGMAMRGIRPFCYSMVPFVLFRTLDQIRCDLCAMRLPVTLVGVGGGLCYGMEGMTHHAIEDIAIARALPNLTILSPGDPVECRSLVKAGATTPGPCYLRLGANNDPIVHPTGNELRVGKLAVLSGEGQAALITTGTMLVRCNEAIRLLREKGLACRLYSAHTLKPLDEGAIAQIGGECSAILSVEEHSLINGLGSAIGEILLSSGYTGRFAKMGIPDEYCTTLGTRDWLRDYYHLSASNIAATVENLGSSRSGLSIRYNDLSSM